MKNRISFVEEENYHYLVYETDNIEGRNNIAINVTEDETIPHLLTAYFSYDNGIKGEYDITDCVPLMETFPDFTGRDDVYPILKKILYVMEELKNNFICEPDIILKKEYIFVDKNTELIKFVATPVILEADNTIKNLFDDILSNVKWKRNENKSYLNVLATGLSDRRSFEELIELINTILAKPIEYIPAENTASEQHNSVQEVVAPQPPVAPRPPVAPQPPIPPQSVVAVHNSSQSVVMPEYDADDEQEGQTTVLGMSNQFMIFPVLIRIKNGEKIVINKSEYTIGKDPVRVDYCIFDNTAVSRVHAKIISKNGEFFVKDNHSTNHVYVNGMLIDSDIEVRLSHSSRVRLGDEDFEFRFQ